MTRIIAILLATGLFAASGATLAGARQGRPQAPPFASQAAPPAPDYAAPASWISGAVTAVAPGATPAVRKGAVDVFYVHPTTDRAMDHWNQDIADTGINGWTDASAVARQAGIFNGCCRVFAPRYRQATRLALFNMTGDGEQAFDLAYSDVERAFVHYIANDNHGRPFILVGHSQGAFHVARLLERKIDGTPLARRLVVAYVIGLNLSEGEFGKTYRTIRICDTPAQTGCVVGWNSVLPDLDRDAMAKGSEQRYIKRYGDDAGKTILCVNPLTFDRSKPAATADVAKGAVPGDPGYGVIAPLRANSVGARCDKGALVVEPAAELGLIPLPGGSMHYHDLGLFYADVRANAALRSAAFLKGRGARR